MDSYIFYITFTTTAKLFQGDLFTWIIKCPSTYWIAWKEFIDRVVDNSSPVNLLLTLFKLNRSAQNSGKHQEHRLIRSLIERITIEFNLTYSMMENILSNGTNNGSTFGIVSTIILQFTN